MRAQNTCSRFDSCQSGVAVLYCAEKEAHPFLLMVCSPIVPRAVELILVSILDVHEPR
jgi:hypothetical protein